MSTAVGKVAKQLTDRQIQSTLGLGDLVDPCEHALYILCLTANPRGHARPIRTI